MSNKLLEEELDIRRLSLSWQIPLDKQLVVAQQSPMNVQFVSVDYRFSIFIF